VIETFDEVQYVSVFSFGSNDCQITPDIAIDGIRECGNRIRIKWNDGHRSTYERQWLIKSGLRQQPRAPDRHALIE